MKIRVNSKNLGNNKPFYESLEDKCFPIAKKVTEAIPGLIKNRIAEKAKKSLKDVKYKGKKPNVRIKLGVDTRYVGKLDFKNKKFKKIK